LIAALAVFAALLLAVATAGSFARDWKWTLLVHFRPHLAVAGVVGAILMLFVDLTVGPRLALVGLLVAMAGLHWREVVHATPAAVPIGAGLLGLDGRLRLASVNVLRGNRRTDLVVDWVRREQVDVLIVCEALQHWPAALTALQDELPHVAGHRHGDVLVFSRHAFVGEPLHLFAAVGNAIAVEIDGIAVVGLHTASPEDANHARACAELIALVKDFAKSRSDPIVLAGDFNATPWSAPVRDLVRTVGLSFGPGARLGTFPAEWARVRPPFWLGIPIDLVLAGHGATVVARRHGPRVGSDHWPVVAEIRYSRVLDPSGPRP
jgi:endonuclease/exonuclease/phosphatase (EEP) superfamily protein YafD